MFDYVLVVSIALLPWVLFLKTPLYPDQSIYAYIAWRWTQGALPYRDELTRTGIGLICIYRALCTRWLKPRIAHLLLAMLACAGQALIVWLLARQLMPQDWPQAWPHVWPTAAVVIFALFIVGPRIEGFTANSELFLNLPIAASFYLLIASGGSTSWLLLAGVAMGCAILIKQVSFLHAASLLVAAVFVGPALLAPALVAAGILAAQLPPLAYFAFHRALRSYLFSNYLLVVKILGYFVRRRPADSPIQPVTWQRRWRLSVKPVLREQGVLFFLGLTGLLLLMYQQRTSGIALGLWLLASLATTGLSLRFNPYFFVVTVPINALLAGYAVQAGINSAAWGLDLPILFLMLLIGTVALALLALFIKSDWSLYQPQSPTSRAIKLWGENDPHVRETLAVEAIAGFVQRTTAPHERVIEAGYALAVPLLSHRRAYPCHVLDNFPIVAETVWWPELIEKTVQHFRDDPPRVIVLHSQYFNVTAFQDLVGLRYRIDAVIADVGLLRAITLNRQALAMYDLCQTFIQANKFLDAQRIITDALHLDPGFVEARCLLACCQANLGRMEQALASLQQALTAGPGSLFDVTIHANFAQLYLAANRLNKAMQHLESAHAIAPGNHHVVTALAEVSQRCGQLERVRSLAEHAMHLEFPHEVCRHIRDLIAVGAPDVAQVGA